MARIWKEPYRGQFAGPGWPAPETCLLAPLLDPHKVIAVKVCSFTFYFHTAEQLKAYAEYFSQKTHPSSRILSANRGGMWSHWEVQRWYERLPMYLLEEPKRRKVESALREALLLVESGKL